MRFWKRSVSTMAAGGLAAALLAGCGGGTNSASASNSTTNTTSTSAATKPAKMTTVTIGINHASVSQLPPFIAEYDNLFKKYNLNVKVTVVPASSLLADVSAGTIDFGGFGAPQPEEAIMHGAPIKWVGMWKTTPTAQMFARTGITTLAGLKGKNVGVSVPGSETDALQREALKKAGVPQSTVNFVSLQKVSAAVAAFESGEVQATYDSPPSATIAKAAVKTSHVLVTYAKGGYYWPDGLVGYMPWVKAHPAATQAVLEAIGAAMKVYKTQPLVTKGVIADISKTSTPTELNASYTDTYKYVADTVTPSLTTEQFIMSVMKTVYPGKYPKASKSYASTLITTTYATAAMKKIGQI